MGTKIVEECKKCTKQVPDYLINQSSPFCFVCLAETAKIYSFLKKMNTQGIVPAPSSGKCVVCKVHLKKDDPCILSTGFKICENCTYEINKTLPYPLEAVCNNQTPQWIVKSSLLVRGPYTDEQIENMIRNRELGALDEIAGPHKIWSYLRDHSQFKNILKELIGTETAEDTQDITRSITESAFGTDPNMNYDTDVAIDIDIDTSESSAKVTDFSYNDVKKKKTGIIQQTVYGVLVLLILLGGAKQYVEFMENSGVENNLQLAKIYWEIGDYDSSFQIYNVVSEDEGQDFESDFRKALYLIHNGQVIRAKRILDYWVQEELSTEEYTQLHNGIGLSYLYNSDYAKAEEYFDKALEFDSAFTPSILNKIEIHLAKGELEAAQELLPETVNFESFQSSFDFLRLYLQVKISAKSQISTIREVYTSAIRDDKDATVLFQLFASLIEYELGDPVLGNKWLNFGIDHLPSSMDRHYQNLHLYTPQTFWKKLNILMRESKALPDLSNANVARAIVHYKAGDFLEAKELLDKAQLQEENSLRVKVYLNYVQGKSVEEALTESIEKSNTIKLDKFLKAQICFKSEKYSCAKENWMQILNLDSQNVEAIFGLAELDYMTGEYQSVESRIQKGLGLAPRFKPLLALERKLIGDIK